MPAVADPPPDRRDDVPLGAHLLTALEMQARVEALVSPLLDDLRVTIPSLRPWRRLASGAWVLGLHGEALPRRGLSDTWSRVDLELRIAAAARSVELTCRATARGRDLPARILAVVLDEAGERRLRAFAEAALLGFAAEYWNVPVFGAELAATETGPA